MTNCVNLNLDISPLKEGLDIKSYGNGSHTKIPLNDINNDLISLLSTLNLTVVFAESFYTAPFAFKPIHIDTPHLSDYIKLNYIYGGKNSLMYWWKPKFNTPKEPSKTAIDIPYIGYTIDEVELIDEQPVKFPSIVQVGIPHNVRNSEEPRYCLSLVLYKQDNTRLTMAESIEIFKQYL